MPAASAIETVPEPCHVAGTPLRPFCLGHHLLFSRLELPFARKPLAEASQAAIMLGVAICANSYEGTLAALLNGEWPNVIKRWRKRLVGPWWNRRRGNWINTESLFRAYLLDGYKDIPRRDYIVSGETMSAPWEQLLKCRLVLAGLSESEALNKYLPAAWYDYYTLMEIRSSEGTGRNFRRSFWTEDDFQRIEAVKHE